jgi:hypothetical protein
LKGNLTNERNTLYIDSDRQDPFFETEVGRTFIVGVSVKFLSVLSFGCRAFCGSFFYYYNSKQQK